MPLDVQTCPNGYYWATYKDFQTPTIIEIFKDEDDVTFIYAFEGGEALEYAHSENFKWSIIEKINPPIPTPTV